MSDGIEVSSGRRARRWHPISEKLKIVKLWLQPGVSVAEVPRAHGVNANQAFTWRRAFERGELSEPCTSLIPVTVSNPEDERRESEAVVRCAGGTIHIELPGRALISAESSADPVLLRSILRAFASDPPSCRDQGVDSSRSGGSAPRVRWTGCAGTERSARTAVLWICVCVPRTERRNHKTSLVGRQWSECRHFDFRDMGCAAV